MNDEYDEEVELETGVAECSANDWMDAPLVVSGVAIGEDEVTRTPEGNRKVWPREALEGAVDSLEGVQLTKNHEHDKVEGVIGEVTKADYKPGVGVLFEAAVHDESVAEKIRQDLLEVSIHALHTLDGMDEDGRYVVAKALFRDLSVVPRGEADSNTVAPGPLATASLSRAELSEVVEESFGTGNNDTNADEAHEGADGFDSEKEASSGAVLASSEKTDAEHDDGEDDASTTESTQSSSAETESELSEQDTDMTEETQEEVDDAELEEAPESEAEEAELEEETEAEEAELSREELEARVAELEDELEALREENDALLAEAETVRYEYAEVLSAGSAFSAEELAEKFSTDELADKYEDADVALAETETRPAPQTGGMSTSEEDELEATDDTAEEIAELEEQIAQYEEHGWDAAADEFRAQLAELTGDE